MLLLRYSTTFVAFLFVLGVSISFAITTAENMPPDELAHKSYVDDVVSGTGMPDYTDGQIGGTKQRNYLSHPPAYYITLGTIGRAMGKAPFTDSNYYRVASALIFSIGALIFVLLAFEFGLKPFEVTSLIAVSAAIPMYGYIAGSINNDVLVYLGIGIALHGLTKIGLNPTRNNWYLAYTAAGIIICLLTKATAAAYLFTTLLALAALNPLKVIELLKARNYQFSLAAIAIISGSYYIPTYLAYGTFFPTAGILYETNVPSSPMSLVEYTIKFASVMWDRLPIIMSHQSLSPISSHFLPLFYLAISLPVLGWLFIRIWSHKFIPENDRVALCDAIMIGFVLTVCIHIYVGYQSYLIYGNLAGWQPRYYLYALPAIWIPFFVVCRSEKFRHTVALIIMCLAIVVFWNHLPTSLAGSSQKNQQTQTLRYNPVAVISDDAISDNRKVLIGRIDKKSIANNSLVIRGWVLKRKPFRPVHSLLLIHNERTVATIPVNHSRPDVEQSLDDPAAAYSGFNASISNLPKNVTASQFSIVVWLDSGELIRIQNPSNGGLF